MRNAELGEGKLGLFVMLLILAAAVFVLVKVVPPRINAYEFKDWMGEYARTDCWNRTPEEMKQDLVAKAKRLNLPLSEKDITIERRGSTVSIGAKFDMPVDLKVYKLVLHYDFNQQAEHY
jgi:hypothetical protein